MALCASPHSLANHSVEAPEEMIAIGRPGCGFRMILQTHDGFVLVAQALKCAIIKIYMCSFNIRDAIENHMKTMILGGYFYFACGEIAYWMIAAMVAEFQFFRPRAKGMPYKLVAKTYANHRKIVTEPFDYGDLIGQGGWIARTVG